MKQIMDDILHLPCIVFAQIGYSIGADVQVAYNRPINKTPGLTTMPTKSDLHAY
jgi:hypothetical protein